MELSEGKEKIAEALRWAIGNGVPQNFRGYINLEDFYDAEKPLEKCSMCAIGVLYAHIFKMKPNTGSTATSRVNAEWKTQERLERYFWNEEINQLMNIIISKNDYGWDFVKILDWVKNYE